VSLNTPYINKFQSNPKGHIQILLNNSEKMIDDLDQMKYQVIMKEDLNIPKKKLEILLNMYVLHMVINVPTRA